jgi:hypothetical protein
VPNLPADQAPHYANDLGALLLGMLAQTTDADADGDGDGEHGSLRIRTLVDGKYQDVAEVRPPGRPASKWECRGSYCLQPSLAASQLHSDSACAQDDARRLLQAMLSSAAGADTEPAAKAVGKAAAKADRSRSQSVGGGGPKRDAAGAKGGTGSAAGKATQGSQQAASAQRGKHQRKPSVKTRDVVRASHCPSPLNRPPTTDHAEVATCCWAGRHLGRAGRRPRLVKFRHPTHEER